MLQAEDAHFSVLICATCAYLTTPSNPPCPTQLHHLPCVPPSFRQARLFLHRIEFLTMNQLRTLLEMQQAPEWNETAEKRRAQVGKGKQR